MPAAPPSAPDHVALPRLMAVLAPAMLLVPISADMVSLLLPRIADQFDASTGQVAWVVTGFLLTCAIGIPLYGRVVDRVGLRRLFPVALGVLAAGSLACALAPSLLVLVAGRMVMGAGGAAIPVLVIVAAARLLPRAQVATGFGILGAAGGVGAAAGPAAGGLLGQLWGWPALFWVVAAAALLLIPAVRAVLTDGEPALREPFDVLGGVLLGAGVGLVLLGVTRLQGAGPLAPSSWGSVLAGVVLAGAFAWRNRRSSYPFVPPALLAHRGYVGAVAVIFLAMVANLATLVLVPILVIEVHGLSPGQGSLVMIPGGLALALTSPLAGRLGSRTDEGTVVLAGLGLIGLATAFLGSFAAGAAPAWAGLAVVALGTGFALVVTPTTSAVGRLLPPELVGVGVGIFQGAQFLGAGVGPAVFGALLAARSGAHGDGASAYADVFLALTAVVLAAAVAALPLRTAARASR